MGNCIPGSPEIVANRTSLDFMDLFNSTYNEDYMYINTDSNDEDFAAAEPCHNHYCPFFHRAAPPYLIATSATSFVATAALLLALFLRPHSWPHGRTFVAQLAACSPIGGTYPP
ncbi:atypical chemokine receptor 1 [Meleagris gallopavo]|uniref:atypical chemokine receptor 1 n=1 Tax=Meleagris gallopavo TaxID=9103 RepID=UPI00093D4AD5|nr:atypical chemokine receptor 1 [Meleagris gallopavo]